jgi:hypothetical protein
MAVAKILEVENTVPIRPSVHEFVAKTADKFLGAVFTGCDA